MCGYWQEGGTWECRGDGYLWDADRDGYDPEERECPCPECNTREFLTREARRAKGGGGGAYGAGALWLQWSAASRWRDVIGEALRANPGVAAAVLAEIGPVETEDFAPGGCPDYRNLVPCIVVPPAPDARKPGGVQS